MRHTDNELKKCKTLNIKRNCIFIRQIYAPYYGVYTN